MKIKKFNNLFYPALIIAICLLPLLDLLHPGLPQTHDGQDHVARIANFYQNLHDGIIIPRWAPNLNWGYGHPVLMFLYPFPSYAASMFHFFGFSFVDSTKLVFALSLILSGLTMYLWLKEFLPRHSAFVGASLYIFAPYRFVDLYVRGAIGEHVAFIFPPLVLYFLLKLSKKYAYKYFVIGSFSLAALILSHNAISIMFLPIFFLYAIFLLHQTKTKKLLAISYLLLAITGFSLSAFFWMPAFMEGKYTLRDIVTKGGYEKNFASFNQLIYSKWSYGGSGDFSLQVGILHWLSVIAALPAIFYFREKKNKLWIITTGLVIIFLVSIFIIDQNSRFLWDKISLIQKFQFPWRFLSVTVFTSAALGSIAASVLNKRTSLITVLVTLVILYVNKDYMQAKAYRQKPEAFYTSIYHGTTDTGESAPIWSVRFMEKVPNSRIEVIGGIAKIEEINRNSTIRHYRISTEQNAQIRENTIYFPGWSIYVDGKPVNIEFQDPNNRGVITFNINKGTHDVKIIFEETKLRIFANTITAGSLFILLLYSILKIWQDFQSSSRRSTKKKT
jgi:hypothetical protein